MAGGALISLSQLCFADEITSGLSSTDASRLILGLRSLAKRCGVSFVVSIHQPSCSIFQSFDDVILLSRGYCLYNGPIQQMHSYFAALGLAPPLHENPAEHYVGLASEEESSERFKKLKDNYKENEEKKREDEVYVHLKCMREKTQKMKGVQPIEAQLEEVRDEETAAKETPKETEKETAAAAAAEKQYDVYKGLMLLLRDAASRRHQPSCCVQYLILQQRALRRAVRDLSSFFLTVFSVYFYSVLTGVLFFKAFYRGCVFYQLSAHVLMCIALSIIPFVNTVTYLERKHQFLHELADGYYSPGPYLLAEGVTSCIMMTITLLPSLIVVFLFCGFPFSRFPLVFLLYFIFEAFVDSVMQLCSALMDTFMGVNAVGGGWLFLASVLNGLNANPRSVPPALRFLVFLSPYFYLFEGLAIALYEDNEEIFSDAEHASRFGYMSSNEMFSYFGLAGTFTKTKLSPKEWFWVADVLPLAACTLGVHAVCWLYWINKRLYK